MQVAAAETLHYIFFFIAGEAAMQQAEFQLRENIPGESFIFGSRGFEFHLRFLDNRIKDVSLASGGNFAANRFPRGGQLRFIEPARGDRRAAGRHFIDHGDIEIAVNGESESTRDGRRSHNEHMRRCAFFHQALALQHAEAVLFVDDHEAETLEFNSVFDQRVRASDELGFAGADAFERGQFFAALHAAYEHFDAVARRREDAARGEKMLHGKNFGRRHDGHLAAIFDGDHRGLESNDSFAAANITFKKPIHRRGAFEIAGDFGEHAFLSAGWLERKNTLDRSADFIVAHAQRDSDLRALFLPARGDAELEEKEFLENHAHVRRAAKTIEKLQVFVGGREMNVHQRFAARGKRVTLADFLRQCFGDLIRGVAQDSVDEAPQHARIDTSDGFINRDYAADLSGIVVRVVVGRRIRENFVFRIDHLAARGAKGIYFHSAVENETHSRFEASFEKGAEKESHAENATRIAHFHQEHAIAIAREFTSSGGGALGLDGKKLAGHYFGDGREADAIFVAEGKVAEQIGERMKAALGEQSGALRADALEPRKFAIEECGHRLGGAFASIY